MHFQYEIQGNWKFMRGCVYGLRQPSISGIIHATEFRNGDLKILEINLAELLDEQMPKLIDESFPIEACIERFAFCYSSLQRQSGIPVSPRYFKIRNNNQTKNSTSFKLVLPTLNITAGIFVLKALASIFNKFSSQVASQSEIINLRNTLHKRLHPFAVKGVNAFHILKTADELNIPIRLYCNNVLALGTGCYTRLLKSSISDRTSSIGVSIAKNKHETARLLRAAGMPGGENVLVKNQDQAIDAAKKLGYPVVVKPADMEQGVGVAADLRNDNDIISAFEAAKKCSSNVLVEKWVSGYTHRLTIVDGVVYKIMKRIAGGVKGDGVSTISELVDLYNQTDLQKWLFRKHGRFCLTLDEEALELLRIHGLKPSDVLHRGEYIRLRRRDNINAGGSNEEIQLDQVHPDNLQLAVNAASLLRLDIAGIDLIIDDIARSWLEIGALICEVNAQPQIGQPDVYPQLLKHLMLEGVRVPAILVIHPANKHRLYREKCLTHYPDSSFSAVDGLLINKRISSGEFANGYDAASALLNRIEIDNAICLMSIQDIYHFGSPLAQWTKIIVAEESEFSEVERRLLSEVREFLHTYRSPLN